MMVNIFILLWLPQLVASKKNKNRLKRTRQQSHGTRLWCELDQSCASLIPEESMNCIHRCVSVRCFKEAYGKEELEPGEIDLPRAEAFEDCVEAELKESRRRERQGIPLEQEVS
jgi:hypothetical protein